MNSDKKIKQEINRLNADIVRFVDISGLDEKQTKGYPHAVLIGLVLSPLYIKKITQTPDYVKKMILNHAAAEDEFNLKEQRTDQMADDMAEYLQRIGYYAYSQSEDNLESTGFYDQETRTTPLPHKTIAGLAGLGWIGKHDLLVTHEFGSAVSMCTVLTDAPIETTAHQPLACQCGDCDICQAICPVQAIRGNTWTPHTSRDELVDVYQCTTCLRCLALCPWTQKYMKKYIDLDGYSNDVEQDMDPA